MLLVNIIPVGTKETVNLAIHQGKIISNNNRNDNRERMIRFTDAMVFPGLINSHDHLDFNCFSPLGEKKHTSYTGWGKHIHNTYKNEIAAVLKIPVQLRTRWGMYKNLLAGVTTVVNHGQSLLIEDPLINIYQQTQNLHSVAFQKKWRWKLNNPFLKNKACVIHAGEGTDTAAAAEIDTLLRWNLLKRQIIAVHGVAMNSRQAEQFAGLIWCPESNKVLLDAHAAVAALKKNTRLVFGTDSTLTGHWNIWEHLRLAKSLQMLTEPELFSGITDAPASLWKLNTGQLQPGKDADLVIAQPGTGHTGWNDFFSINPEDIVMVMQKGMIRLFDASLLPQIKKMGLDSSGFHPVVLQGRVKFVEGNLPGLTAAIRHYYPEMVFPFEGI